MHFIQFKIDIYNFLSVYSVISIQIRKNISTDNNNNEHIFVYTTTGEKSTLII